MAYHKDKSEAQLCPICNPSACSEVVLSETHSALEMANTRVFILTRADVIGCARQMGIPEEAITDEVLEQVKKGMEWGLECWHEVMCDAINFALKS